MFTVILAIGAGYLLGNKEVRVKADKFVRSTLGNAVDMINNKKAVKSNEITDKQISENDSAGSDADGILQ